MSIFDDIVPSVLGTGIRVLLILGFLSFLLSLGRDVWKAWSPHE